MTMPLVITVFPVPMNNFQVMNILSKAANHLAITADDREYWKYKFVTRRAHTYFERITL